METAFYTGIGLCAVAGLRCAGAAVRWISDRRRERHEFLASLAAFEDELDRKQKTTTRSPVAWKGYRPFVVQRVATATDTSAPGVTSNIRFEQSGVSAAWEEMPASLLEVADAQGLNLPSGCRSGNCGMCAMRLLAGQVRYAVPPTAPIDSGFCLACIAQPNSRDVVLDA